MIFPYQIRLAKPGDASGILEIYAPIVLHTHTSFEYEIPEVDEFSERISKYSESLPWIVCCEDNKIIGYAYAVQVRGRMAYSWSAELSVYVHDDYMSRGIGKKLYEVLMDLLRLQGVRNFYAVIALPNKNSEVFHRNLGFEKLTVFEKIGYKERWIDIAWYLKTVEGIDPPKKMLSMNELMAAARTAEIMNS